MSVSETARGLAALRSELGELNTVRPERLSGLQAVMAKGQYSADLRDVARKILRELLGQLVG